MSQPSQPHTPMSSDEQAMPAPLSSMRMIAMAVWKEYYNTLMHSEMTTCHDALAAAIREATHLMEYYQPTTDIELEDNVVDARDLFSLAEELEKLGAEE